MVEPMTTRVAIVCDYAPFTALFPRAAIEEPGTVVVDVRVTREENTYPMIAPGAAARDMVG